MSTGSECPVDGCRKPFDSPNALANHLFRKKGEGHDQYDEWEKADRKARSTWGEEPPSGEQDTPSEGGESGDGGDPTMGTTEPPTGGGGSEERCPVCGGDNLFVPSKVPGVPDGHKVTQFDRGCKDCSTSEAWEVFDL